MAAASKIYGKETEDNADCVPGRQNKNTNSRYISMENGMSIQKKCRDIIAVRGPDADRSGSAVVPIRASGVGAAIHRLRDVQAHAFGGAAEIPGRLRLQALRGISPAPRSWPAGE